MAKMEAQTLGQVRASLGECPVWSAEEGAVYWVDIEGPTVHRTRLADGQGTAWTMPSMPGCLALRASGGLVVALQGGLFAFDPASGRLDQLCEIEPGRPEMRPNDGRCDPAGRMLVGTMALAGQEPVGRLYRVDTDFTVTELWGGLRIPNGLAFSPDGTVMYHTDTRAGLVERFDYDVATGTPSDPRPFIRFDPPKGAVDGAAVDAEGGYWTALFFGGRIARFGPDGTEDRAIRLAALCPTMPAFCGPDLTTLVATTSRHVLSPAQAEAQPLAGRLFRAEAGIAGLPEPKFGG
jgi:sugar lactone lactonase YvrE